MHKPRVHGAEHGPVRIEKAPFGLGDTAVEPISWLSVKEPEITSWIPDGDLFAPLDAPEPEPEVLPETSLHEDEGQTVAPEEPVATEPGPAEEAPPAEEPERPSWEEHEAALNEQLAAQAELLAEPYVASARELRETAVRLNQDTDEAVIQMALTVAEVILRKQAEVSPDLLQQILEETLSMVGPVSEISLEVHPDDLERSRALAPEIAEEIAGKAVNLSVSASAEVDPATCIVHFDRGVIDARWGARLLQLGEAIRQSLASGVQGPSGSAPDVPDAPSTGEEES